MTPRALLAPARLAGQSILRTQADERLVDLVGAGSEAAFEAIVARYRRPLMGYLRRLLAEERAEDALQQTFVKAHAAIERGEQVRSLRSWLYRIAHNTAANLIRDNTYPHEPLDEHLGGGERPDQVADRRQALTEVLSAVQSLPLRQRDAIVLRELEGRSYEEIAGELGVTHGAVRALLNRARTTIRSSVTAVTPAGWLVRLVGPLVETPAPGRLAELCGAATVSKVCATALVTGAAAGGASSSPHVDIERTAPTGSASAANAAAPANRVSYTPSRAARTRIASAPVTHVRSQTHHRVKRTRDAAVPDRAPEETRAERQPRSGPAPGSGGAGPAPDGDRYATSSAEPRDAGQRAPAPTDTQPYFDASLEPGTSVDSWAP
jgi:RNA polymerase sigma factor (sigma-70 family)